MGDRLPTPLDRARTPADRQREYRRRQRKGEVVAPVAVTHTIIDLLIGLGWIEAEASESRQELGRAINRVLSEVALATRKENVTRLRDLPAARATLRK